MASSFCNIICRQVGMRKVQKFYPLRALETARTELAVVLVVVLVY